MNRLLVSLTFDDALHEHLDLAGPALEAHGFRGTFYLPIRTETVTERADEWRALAARGHELGNHTVFHPGFGTRPWVRPGNAIERYDVDRMHQELEVANRVLKLLDGGRERSFAYPCNNSVVGTPGLVKRGLRALRMQRSPLMDWLEAHPKADIGSSEKDYSGILPRFFIAARAGHVDAGADVPFPPARYMVPCIAADGRPAAGLRHDVDDALARRSWVVLMFHGVGGTHPQNCDPAAFEDLLDFLAMREDVDVLTFRDAARRVWPE